MVYLIHFDRPLWKNGPQHYTGYTLNLARRLREHRSGKGARVLRQANECGISWKVVRVWKSVEATESSSLEFVECDSMESLESRYVECTPVECANRTLERKLKRKGARLLCPVCC